MEDEVSLGFVGAISVKSGRYDVYFHSYEWNKRDGFYLRGAYRILFIRDLCCYVGSYRVPGLPLISGKTIKFDLPDDQGATIAFSEDGPPTTIRLDGEYMQMFR